MFQSIQYSTSNVCSTKTLLSLHFSFLNLFFFRTKTTLQTPKPIRPSRVYKKQKKKKKSCDIQAFFEPAAFHVCPVPNLPNPVVSDELTAGASPREGSPGGAAVVGGRLEKPGRKELVGIVWMDKNLFGGGRSSLLCCEKKKVKCQSLFKIFMK